MEQTKVLVVPAYVDVADPDKSQWVARSTAPPASPFAGLFAFGADFASARKALASTVWEAVCGGSTGLVAAEVAAVRVLALTRKTFTCQELGGVGS